MVWDISSIIAAIAFIWAIYEFRNSNHLRRMERTLDVLPALREEYFDLAKKILNNGALTSEGEKLLREYLSKMERFAVGANHKLYDLSLINEMSGRVLIGQYNRYIQKYINKRIEEGMAPTTYCEYEKLIHNIMVLREKKVMLLCNSGNKKADSHEDMDN